MKLTKFYFLLFTAVSLSFAAKAQTADDIIGKYVDAIGGKDKLAQIKSVYIDGTASVMGNDGTVSSTLLVGKGYRSDLEVMGSKVTQCITDKSGWMVNPFTGAADPTPMPDDEYQASKDDLWLGGALVNYKADGYTAELLPKDGNNFVIKVTAGKKVTTYSIDATTYLLNKEVVNATVGGQPYAATTTYSNYQKTDFGYVAPYKVDLDLGQVQLSYVTKTVTVNKDIDPKIFVMPAK